MIKEKCENKEIENIIWISKEKQLADSLAKKVLVVKSWFRIEIGDVCVYIKKSSYKMFVSRKKKDIILCFKTNLRSLN